MNKVLLTGASGFVGGFIVEALLDKGFETYAAVRKSSSRKYLQDPRIKFIEIDFEEEDDLRAKLVKHQFDYYILNAGVTKAKDEATYFKVNSGYTRKFCKILMEEQLIPKKLIYISSIAAYGPADFQAEDILTNQSTPHPVTKYGRSKLQAEQFLETFPQIPKIIFRPTVVYGPREYDMLEMYKTINKGFEITVGKEEQLLTFIYVEDLASLVADALESQVINNSYFVSDGSLYKTSTLNDILKDLLDKKTIKFSIPVPLLKVLAFFSEKSAAITGKFPILNVDKVNELIPKSWNCDSTPLQKDFNFAPLYNLEKGMEKTVKWCKAESLL